MSLSRRKSLATASTDELNEILKELDPAIDVFEDDAALDDQIQSILDDYKRRQLTIKEEEDEIDELVKQHNLLQGVQEDALVDDLLGGELAMPELDLVGLDEIATLAPLIDAHNHEPRKKASSAPAAAAAAAAAAAVAGSRAPLMGKPAVPRMGRPAAIQPPASRLYGRPLAAPGSPARYTAPLGMPTHLVAQGSNAPLKVAHGTLGFAPMKPPQPVLVAPLMRLGAAAAAAPPSEVISTPLLMTNVKVLSACAPRTYAGLTIPAQSPRTRRREAPRRPPKKVYLLDEIPEQYRIKPTLSYTLMISNVLKAKDGLTASAVAECVKQAYPYYNYCADGWQVLISHNLLLNRVFKKTVRDDGEWVWSIDHAYISERERVRLRQQEVAAAKAKAAALMAEELKQKQRMEAARPAFAPGGRPPFAPPAAAGAVLATAGAARPKTIAELASEIRREGSKAPLYFKPAPGPAGAVAALGPAGPTAAPVAAAPPPLDIKLQLAANRASPAPGALGINSDTKKSLAYLQKELFTLYKARKLLYNTATTTEIITRALATTIAQVNVIGAKAGCGANALSFLVEKAPQQVSKILDIALSKSIKEKQGALSTQASRSATPSAVGSPQPAKEGLSKPPLFQAKPPKADAGRPAPQFASASALAVAMPAAPPRPALGAPMRPAFQGPAGPAVGAKREAQQGEGEKRVKLEQ